MRKTGTWLVVVLIHAAAAAAAAAAWAAGSVLLPGSGRSHQQVAGRPRKLACRQQCVLGSAAPVTNVQVQGASQDE